MSKRYGYRTCIKSESIEDDLGPTQVRVIEINPAVDGVLPVIMSNEEPMVRYVNRSSGSMKNHTAVGRNKKFNQQYFTPKPKREIGQDNGWVHAGAWVLVITWLTISPASYGLIIAEFMFFTAFWSTFFAPNDVRTPKYQFWLMLLLSLIIGTISVYYLMH